MPKPANKPRKKATAYKMPLPLPLGLVVQDVAKKNWKLGPSIGKGGFGEIYSAQELSGTSGKNYPFVIKIEPHANGPLFVEMHFYMRAAKPTDVKTFKAKKKLSTFGMPEYLGSGSHEHNGEKYRFLVMHKFGDDIWKLFLENNRCFPVDTVFKLGVQILDVLEYIHSKGYIHGDVKGANILLGTGKEAGTQVYLVDFGLCSHYSNVYKHDPKKAHNGTIEYLSRDAHLGVESRRGDLEILGYNLTQWLGCLLPWEKNLADPVSVQNSKQMYMDNLTNFFKTCFKNSQSPAALVDYFKYVTSLKFETDPDYKKLRKILQSGVEATGGTLKSLLKFKIGAITPSKRKISKSRSPVKKRNISVKTKDAHGNLSENEVLIKTSTPKRSKIDTDDGDNESDEEEGVANSSSYGYNVEMLRLKHKLDAKKKQKSNAKGNSSNDLREKKVVNHNKSVALNHTDQNDSVVIVSNSESEEEVLPKRRVLRNKSCIK